MKKLLLLALAIGLAGSLQAQTILTQILLQTSGVIVTNLITLAPTTSPTALNVSDVTVGASGGSLAFYGATTVQQASGAGQAAAATTAAVTGTNLITQVNASTAAAVTLARTNWVFLCVTAPNTTSEVTLSVLTNVTINTVYGFAATMPGVVTNVTEASAAHYGFTTSSQPGAIVTLLNAIRTALVNLGLIKGGA
jgi:hypothetical protein